MAVAPSAPHCRAMSVQKYTKQEVAKHNSFSDPVKSVWVTYKQHVLDISTFDRAHPGGMEILTEFAGGDITQAFNDKGHTPYARMLMAEMKIGELVRNDSSLASCPSVFTLIS